MQRWTCHPSECLLFKTLTLKQIAACIPREKGFQFEGPPYEGFTQLKDTRKKKNVWQDVEVEI